MLEEDSYETVVGFGDAKVQERSATKSPGDRIIPSVSSPIKATLFRRPGAYGANMLWEVADYAL